MTRAAVTLALLGVYLGLAFGLRSYLQRRRTGSTGFRGISGPPLSAAWWGGVLFVVALVGSVVAPTLAALAIDHPLVVTRALDVVGLVAFVVGTAFLLWSQGVMGGSWRIGVDDREVTTLVTTGPFAWVRNPFFTGTLLSALGVVALVPNRTALVAYAILLLAIELQVRCVEEPYLERVHGERYRAYRRRVGRFAPEVGVIR